MLGLKFDDFYRFCWTLPNGRPGGNLKSEHPPALAQPGTTTGTPGLSDVPIGIAACLGGGVRLRPYRHRRTMRGRFPPLLLWRRGLGSRAALKSGQLREDQVLQP